MLEKIGRGKYRRIDDRYKNIGEYMRDSGEFRSIYNQRKANKKQQEAYRDHLKQVKQTKDKYSETVKVLDQHMYNPPGYCSSGDDVDITMKEEG